MADIRNYMKDKGLSWDEVQRPAGLTAVLNCPSCDDKDKSFAVSLNDGAFNCMRLNNCGIKGSWWDFQKLFNDKPKALNNDNYIKRTKPVYKKPTTKAEPLKTPGTKFLIDRGFTADTIKHFKLGEKNGAILFPYFREGIVVNIKFRAIAEKKFWQEKDTEPALFNRDNGVGQALMISEGEFDTMAWHQYDFPSAVSVPQGAKDLSWVEHEWDFLDKFQRIYLNFDNDTAGQENILEIVNRLGQWRCYNITLPYKDANECLLKNVTQEQMKECIESAKEFDPVILKNVQDFRDDIIDTFENPQKMYGIETPWTRLNELLRGWREEELTIWSGQNSSGKSTMLNEVVRDLIIRKKQNVMMASLEMPPVRYLRWMMMSIAESSYVSRDKVDEILAQIQRRLFIMNIVGEASPDTIIDIFEYAARKYGVKHFVVDSLMKIEIAGTDKYENQKKFCNTLLGKVAVPFKAHVHLVAHPRKQDSDSDKPGKVDVAGTGDITNLAHNVLMVWRPNDDARALAEKKGKELADSMLFLKKNREWGSEGSVKFTFDETTKKLTEQIKEVV